MTIWVHEIVIRFLVGLACAIYLLVLQKRLSLSIINLFIEFIIYLYGLVFETHQKQYRKRSITGAFQ